MTVSRAIPFPLWWRGVALPLSRLVLILAILTTGFLAGAPGEVLAAQSADTLTVQGQVRNGTEGGGVPTGRQVRVIALVGDRVEGSWEAPVQEDGSYSVTGVRRIPDATYAVGVEYGNAAYVDRVDVGARAEVAIKDLTVHEGVSVDPGIRFEQSAVVLSSASPERGTLELTEVHSIVNPTDVTFVPSAQGPGGPAGLLVFALPAGAAELTPLMGLDPTQIVQIDRGFASLVPIYPGRTDLSFRYRIPYGDAALRLERTVRYPIDAYRVLSSEPHVTLQSSQLTESTQADIGGRAFQAISGGPFTPGTVVTVVASGLPVRAPPLAGMPVWLIPALGAIIGLGTVAYAVGQSRQARPQTEMGDREAIVDELVALERQHREGRIDEEAYREERQALVAQAIAAARLEEHRENGGPP